LLANPNKDPEVGVFAPAKAVSAVVLFLPNSTLISPIDRAPEEGNGISLLCFNFYANINL
jgi:hypothetical protein